MRHLPMFVEYPEQHGDCDDADHFFDQAKEVYRERVRAHKKHDANGFSMERAEFDNPRWVPVVVEEIGEVAKEVVDSRLPGADFEQGKARLRKELIQVMAMCSAWIDAIDMDHVDPSGSESANTHGR